MKFKGFIILFILVLGYLGINLGKNNAPNQQIVVQFDYKGIEEDQTSLALKSVTEMLQSIGIEKLHIARIDPHTIKISYYSDVAIHEVQQLFLDNELTQLGLFDKEKGTFPNQLPERNSNLIHLAVDEIQNPDSNTLGLNGIRIDGKFLSDPHLKISFSKGIFSHRFTEETIKVSRGQKTFFQNTTLIGNLFLLLPEVRAGPINLGIAREIQFHST